MDGKRIQFGHTQGILILVLGFILIAAQALISFHLLPSSIQSPTPEKNVPVVNRVVFFIPGIAGILMTTVGLFFILQDRFRNRSTNPPAKTKSGFPM